MMSQIVVFGEGVNYIINGKPAEYNKYSHVTSLR